MFGDKSRYIRVTCLPVFESCCHFFGFVLLHCSHDFPMWDKLHVAIAHRARGSLVAAEESSRFRSFPSDYGRTSKKMQCASAV